MPAGAVIGTVGGHAFRARLAKAFGRDRPAAFIEDAVAYVGALIIVICCRLPLGNLNSNAMPRGLLSASEASGSPPARENRATTCSGMPENKGDREYIAPSGEPTNVPSAQVPFV